MRIEAGQNLLHYRLIEKIGEGGMGVVWKAEDTKLHRRVALKVLPEAMAADPDRRARFEREARAVAALNHPNIVTLHSVEEAATSTGSVHFITMELVEGQNLTQLLPRNGFPLDRLLEIAIPLADAVSRAHRAGITHRDLKPDNVMIDREGRLRVLDFGLAKLQRPAGTTLGTQAPTVTSDTADGRVLGTVAYMSPEQAEGKDVDARSDIFSLGTILYEMASGKRPFRGDTTMSTIGAILKDEPLSITDLKPMLPRHVGRLIHRCLSKDPEVRWQSAHDVMLELKWLSDAESAPDESPSGVPARGGWIAWGAAIAGLAAALAIAVIHWSAPAPETRVASFKLTLPEEHSPIFARVSPDGRYLSATVVSAGQSRIWVRPLDSLEGRSLPGTEGLRYHFWSPDSRSIGFIADGKLKRIDLAAGPPRPLCDAPGAGPFRLGAWGADGTILFRVDEAPGQEGLYRVPAEGGTPTPFRVVDESGRQLNAAFPSFLPDGRHFLAMCAEPLDDGDFRPLGVCAIAIDTGRARVLLSDPAYAEYAPPGYLLHTSGGVLFAQPFDARELRVHGEPTRITDGLDHWDGMGIPSFSASRNGVLVYQTAATQLSRLVWMDRRGASIGEVGSPGEHISFRLSPDGKRLARTTVHPESRSANIWIDELARNVATRFTSSLDAGFGVWSPDGDRIVFCQPINVPPFLHHKPLSGGDEQVLLESSGTLQCPTDWSRDGRFLLFTERDPNTGFDIWSLPMRGDEKPVPFLRSRYSESQASFSPDGRWVAFTSDESGEPEVYVQPFEEPGGKRRVSSAGGWRAKWRRDGDELFYVSSDHELMAVPVTSGASLELGSPTALFSIDVGASALAAYDVGPDGSRFLVNVAMPGTAATPTVVLDWHRERGDGR